MTDVVLTGEGSLYVADQQFGMEFGGTEGDGEEGSREVRVKAFVPDWIRNRIVEKDVRR